MLKRKLLVIGNKLGCSTEIHRYYEKCILTTSDLFEQKAAVDTAHFLSLVFLALTRLCSLQRKHISSTVFCTITLLTYRSK